MVLYPTSTRDEHRTVSFDLQTIHALKNVLWRDSIEVISCFECHLFPNVQRGGRAKIFRPSPGRRLSEDKLICSMKKVA
jgi:hypothetical protein